MKRIAWLTDVHLNFLSVPSLEEFLTSLAALAPDGVLLGGDVGESQDVCDYLDCLQRMIDRPIYFVLGNHDFYHGSIREVRRRVGQLCDASRQLRYLTTAGVERLSERVGLIGHDGWADGRAGDYLSSSVWMNDFRLIDEVSGLSATERWKVLQALGDEAATHVRHVLGQAVERFEEVWLLTHVPPLRQAAWYAGRTSDDDWAPFFVCQAVGDVILDIMAVHPSRKLRVFCGHTHGAGTARPLENVEILTGSADYGHPKVQQMLELE